MGEDGVSGGAVELKQRLGDARLDKLSLVGKVVGIDGDSSVLPILPDAQQVERQRYTMKVEIWKYKESTPCKEVE